MLVNAENLFLTYTGSYYVLQLIFENLIRSYGLQVVFCTCWFASNSLYTCKSEGAFFKLICFICNLKWWWRHQTWPNFTFQAIELMLVDALLEANEHLGISSSIQQPAEFWKVNIENHLWFRSNFHYCTFVTLALSLCC